MVCALLAVLLILPGLAVAEQEPIKIGVFEPLSGAKAAGGIMEYEGIQAAHDMFPAALGYDAYLVAIKAIEAAGSVNGEAVREAIGELELDGATGKYAFDQNGDAIRDRAVVKTVQNGEFKYLQTIILE